MSQSQRISAVQSPIIPMIGDMIRNRPGTLSLGQGVVHYGPPPSATAQIERFLADGNGHKYQPVNGIPPLLAQIEAKLARENGIHAGASSNSRIMVTAGGNQAFMNAVLAIADPGDEIILPTPYYFNQEMAITLAGGRPVLVSTDAQYQLDLGALRAAITNRTRAIVTVSPNNPSGAVYPAAALRAVNALCRERGIFHVSDEAYEYFTYDGAEHYSAASDPDAAGHTISLFSMSKAYGMASWRIGWMVYPERLDAGLRKIQDTLLICPPVISQHVALGALETGRTYVDARLAVISEVRNIVRHALRPLEQNGICEISAVRGAFYCLLRVNTALAPLALTQRLIREQGVAVIPGNAFGLDHGCHLRVAYGTLLPDTAMEAIGRLVQGLGALRQ